MGLSSSKRVTKTLKSSQEFTTACTTVYQQSLTLTQHTFPGIPRYQIPSATDHLHQTLTDLHIPLIDKWVTSPPTRTQIDKSLKKTLPVTDGDGDNNIVTVGEAEFIEFAVGLYSDAIVSNANKDVMVKVPVGVAGIAAVGMVARFGVQVVGTVVGVYAVGVATEVYLSLGG